MFTKALSNVIRKDNLKMETQNTTEIQQLKQTIIRMLESIENAKDLERIRNFVHDMYYKK